MCCLGGWSDIAAGTVEWREGGDDRAGEQPTGVQVGARAVQERGSLGRAVQQLEGLHRHEAQGKVTPVQIE